MTDCDDIRVRIRLSEAIKAGGLVREVAWLILQALHKEVPETERPMSWSDVSAAQEARLVDAAKAAIGKTTETHIALRAQLVATTEQETCPICGLADSECRARGVEIAGYQTTGLVVVREGKLVDPRCLDRWNTPAPPTPEQPDTDRDTRCIQCRLEKPVPCPNCVNATDTEDNP